MFVTKILLCTYGCILTLVLGQDLNENLLVKEWKCVNRECSDAISTGETNFHYSSPDHKLKLKFKAKDEVTILRKPGDNEKDQELWWISLNGKEGYVNKQFIKEWKLLGKKLINVNEIDIQKKYKTITPTPSVEVAEGTTIYHEYGEVSQIGSHQRADTDVLNSAYITENEEDGSVNIESKKEKVSSSIGMNTRWPSSVPETEPSTLEKSASPKLHGDSNLSNTIEESPSALSISASLNEDKNETGTQIDVKREVNSEVIEKSPSDKGILNIDIVNSSIMTNLLNASTIDSEASLKISQRTLESNDVANAIQVDKQVPEEFISADSVDESVQINNSVDQSTSSATFPPNLHNHQTNISFPSEMKDNTNITERKEPEAIKENAPEAIKENAPEAIKENAPEATKEKVPSKQIDPFNAGTLVSNSDSPLKPSKHSLENSREENVIAPPEEPINAMEMETTSSTSVDTKNKLHSEDNTFSHSYLKKVEENEEEPDMTTLTPSKSISTISLNADGRDGSTASYTFKDVNTGTYENDDLPVMATETVTEPTEHSGYLSSLKPDESVDELLSGSDIHNPKEGVLSDDISLVEEDQIIRQKLESEEHRDSSQNWYSSVHSFMDSLKELYFVSFKYFNSEPGVLSSEINELQLSPSLEQCHLENGGKSPGDYCKKMLHVESMLSPQDDFGPEVDSDSNKMSTEVNGVWYSLKSICWLIGSSLVILCFSLGYYYLENMRRDGELVQKNNVLSSELFVLEREKAVLEEELVSLKEKMNQLSEEKRVTDEEFIILKEDLRKTKEEKINVGERETKLIKKYLMVEQNYNELRRIFSESKQKGERAILISDIKKLKESIAADNVKISALKEELQEKKNEVKSLNTNLQKSNEAKVALQEQIDKMVVERQDIAKGYQETLSKMEQTIEENKAVQSHLEDDLRKQKKECESLLIEKELAESALQKAHGLTSTESLTEWLEIKEIRSSLINAEKNIAGLVQERDQLLLNLESAEEKSKSLASEVQQLYEQYERAEKEKIEALTKLQVLSNYFKEKESQLQEELGMKEAQWLQKQGDDSTIYQQMRDLREENVNLKGLIETLKKEILDQETTYKKIINTTEQKAHENWVSFRRAEIRLKEVQAEAAQLRNRLSTLETCDDTPEDKLNKTGGLEVNGDLPALGSAMSPPFMLYSNEFIPPPPLLPPPAGGNPSARPPPLGRISSPPLVSGDFIPPPPLLPPYDVYSHVHPTPPSPPLPPSLLHKPQPRDHHMVQPTLMQSSATRKQKDSQSSNHSSESPLDKTPARRGKR